jgi:hypothetical protein
VAPRNRRGCDRRHQQGAHDQAVEQETNADRGTHLTDYPQIAAEHGRHGEGEHNAGGKDLSKPADDR